MQYPSVSYVRVDPAYLELHSFDGTYRGVMFRDARAADLAMVEGRAEVDVAAIERGFLPSGAYLVSRAADALEAIEGVPEADAADPLGSVRRRLAVSRTVARSGYVTEATDALARSRDPSAANRYEAIVKSIAGDGA